MWVFFVTLAVWLSFAVWKEEAEEEEGEADEEVDEAAECEDVEGEEGGGEGDEEGLVEGQKDVQEEEVGGDEAGEEGGQVESCQDEDAGEVEELEKECVGADVQEVGCGDREEATECGCFGVPMPLEAVDETRAATRDEGAAAADAPASSSFGDSSLDAVAGAPSGSLLGVSSVGGGDDEEGDSDSDVEMHHIIEPLLTQQKAVRSLAREFADAHDDTHIPRWLADSVSESRAIDLPVNEVSQASGVQHVADGSSEQRAKSQCLARLGPLASGTNVEIIDSDDEKHGGDLFALVCCWSWTMHVFDSSFGLAWLESLPAK